MLSDLLLVNIVDITILRNDEVIAQQKEIDWNHKMKYIPWYWIAGKWASPIYPNLGTAIVEN
jgi:hypothetical protein